MSPSTKREQRRERIREHLREAQAAGAVREWYLYAPGDRRGSRWVIDLGGALGELRLSTAEAEAFALGVTVALDAKERPPR